MQFKCSVWSDYYGLSGVFKSIKNTAFEGGIFYQDFAFSNSSLSSGCSISVVPMEWKFKVI